VCGVVCVRVDSEGGGGGGGGGGRILPNSRALVLHQGGQCSWARRMKEWSIRAHTPRSKRITCVGQGSSHV